MALGWTERLLLKGNGPFGGKFINHKRERRNRGKKRVSVLEKLQLFKVRRARKLRRIEKKYVTPKAKEWATLPA